MKMENANQYTLQKRNALAMISLLSEKPRHLSKQGMSYQQKLRQYRNQNMPWLRLKNTGRYLKTMYRLMRWSNHDSSFSSHFVEILSETK